MSYDVFFRGFAAGELSGRGGQEMLEVLMPHLAHSDETFRQVRVGDGEADIYLSPSGMMANHISGRDPWELLVHGARAADWVILPPDCPTCLTRAGQLADLPPELVANAVLVESGRSLLDLIHSH